MVSGIFFCGEAGEGGLSEYGGRHRRYYDIMISYVMSCHDIGYVMSCHDIGYVMSCHDIGYVMSCHDIGYVM